MSVRERKIFACKRGEGFTLVEEVVALALMGIIMGVVVHGYVSATDLAEWSAYSVAAQSVANQGIEQVRGEMGSAEIADHFRNFTRPRPMTRCRPTSIAASRYSGSAAGKPKLVGWRVFLQRPSQRRNDSA